MADQHTSVSRFLSLVLRHRPDVIGLQLDPEGWLDVNALVENANACGRPLTLQAVHDVVTTNDKQRFEFSPDGGRIRARQGHSLAHVDLNSVPREPPEHLYHGTVRRFLPSIRGEGLRKGERQHVHLSADRATAEKVGARRGPPVVLTVASRQMYLAGWQFYRSANGVWLTIAVPTAFITFPE